MRLQAVRTFLWKGVNPAKSMGICLDMLGLAPWKYAVIRFWASLKYELSKWGIGVIWRSDSSACMYFGIGRQVRKSPFGVPAKPK